jgi:hypothetical protein
MFRIVSPLAENFKVLGGYRFCFNGFFQEHFVVAERVKRAVSGPEILLGFFQSVREHGQQSFHGAAGFTQGLYRFQTGFSGGDEVFDHNDCLSGFQFAFDEILTAVVFRRGADVNEW